MAQPLTFLTAVGFALVFSGKLRFLEGIPRSRWLSRAGGISVTYLFSHLLPEPSEGQEELERALGSLEQHTSRRSSGSRCSTASSGA